MRADCEDLLPLCGQYWAELRWVVTYCSTHARDHVANSRSPYRVNWGTVSMLQNFDQ